MTVSGSSPRAFALDRFQTEAIAALDEGASVLVAAPTGAGKTVVAEHAVDVVVRTGGKVFYTTPIKALSNQKFHDLTSRHGAEQVGLLTGDNAINGGAPVVVMTTEVLRNMIYARSGALDGLRFVVLDEVHYLQDAYRGPAWEEVIIHLPPAVRLVCLSATVSNADELADWIETVRGPTRTVLEATRPVDLENLYAVRDRDAGELVVVPTLVEGRPNTEAGRYDVDPRQQWRDRRRRRYATPSRVELAELLRERDLLPVIYFLFSRAGCDDAVKGVIDAGMCFTSADEQAEIRAIAHAHVQAIGDIDLEVLQYERWSDSLASGVAAHHAGMVPPFKEAVEACFVEGLVKIVFATETLALGINMPARSVIIEKLTKYTGERHEFLTPAQYTQLTGRAGRRGIDDHGTALALWSPFVSFEEVAGLAASKTYRLTSSFRPTYNMAANLVRRYEAVEAHRLLNLSFAQYQSDRAVVRVEARLAKRQAYRDEVRASACCELGDVFEYRELVRAERAAQRQRRRAGSIDDGLSTIKPGDVIWVAGGKSPGPAAVLSVAQRKGGNIRVKVITPARRVVHLGSSDFDDRPEVIATVALPVPFAPQTAGFQRAVASALTALDIDGLGRPRLGGGDVDDEGAGRSWHHPVDRCPDRDDHLRAVKLLGRVDREVADLERQVQSHSETLARAFDRILGVLEAWGYLDGWALTERGERLVAIFHESDLLIAECIASGLLDDLDPPTLAGLVSCFTYEHRSSAPAPEPWFPRGEARGRFGHIASLAAALAADEAGRGMATTRPPDPGFFAIAYAWAAGSDLEGILGDEELSGGDFVRNVKQLADLLRQVEVASDNPRTVRTARQAGEGLFRGVVAASAVVSTGSHTGEGVDDDLSDDDVLGTEP